MVMSQNKTGQRCVAVSFVIFSANLDSQEVGILYKRNRSVQVQHIVSLEHYRIIEI